jgi:small conductance mechanosensitive channel
MDSEWVERAVIAGVVVVAALVLARLADGAVARRLEQRPDLRTRYRILRRSIVAVIVGVGVVTALLVIPQVRAVAGGILASSAVIAFVVGLAAQTTLSNFVAGIFIAFAQPVHLGDRVSVGGAEGTVQEIQLTYTVIRSSDGARFYVPNAKLASDTIRNATIASAAHPAVVTVSVPLSADLDRVLSLLVEEARRAPEAVPDKEPTATVTSLEATSAVVTVEAWASSVARAEALASELRRRVSERLRNEKVYA